VIVGGYSIGSEGGRIFSRFLGGAFGRSGAMRAGSETPSNRLSRYRIVSTGAATIFGWRFA